MDDIAGTAPDLDPPTFDIGDDIDPFADASEGPSGEPWLPNGMGTMPSIPDLIDGIDLPAPDLTTPEPAAPALPEPEPAAPAPPESEPAEDPAEQPPSDGTYGNAAAWTTDWFYQEVNGYCGPSSAAQLISEYTGLDITSPQQMVDRALELGLFLGDDPSQGMTLDGIEALLDDQDVPCHIESGTLDDLKTKLDDGYGIIAMVDSGEIWYRDEEFAEDSTPDHVVVVAGIDEARGVIILSDPGSPTGNGLEVPIDQFMDSWADGENQMIVADAPDPDLDASDDSVAALQPRPWAILDLIGLQ